jgi:chromosome segregation ATPase
MFNRTRNKLNSIEETLTNFAVVQGDILSRLEKLESAPKPLTRQELHEDAALGVVAGLKAVGLEGIISTIQELEKSITGHKDSVYGQLSVAHTRLAKLESHPFITDTLLELPNRVENITQHWSKKLKELESRVADLMAPESPTRQDNLLAAQVNELESRIKSLESRPEIPSNLPIRLDSIDRYLDLFRTFSKDIQAEVQKLREDLSEALGSSPGVWSQIQALRNKVAELKSADDRLQGSLDTLSETFVTHSRELDSLIQEENILWTKKRINDLRDDLSLLMTSLGKQFDQVPAVPEQPARRIVTDVKEKKGK